MRQPGAYRAGGDHGHVDGEAYENVAGQQRREAELERRDGADDEACERADVSRVFVDIEPTRWCGTYLCRLRLQWPSCLLSDAVSRWSRLYSSGQRHALSWRGFIPDGDHRARAQ